MNLYISDLHFGHKNVILFEAPTVFRCRHDGSWSYVKI